MTRIESYLAVKVSFSILKSTPCQTDDCVSTP